MDPTITLEFTADDLEQLKELDHELKQIHGVQVFFVEPRDQTAPVLISLGIRHKREQSKEAIRRITHVLYDFVHSSASEGTRRIITLVSIEGESVNIAPLNVDEIYGIIDTAYAGQAS